MRQNNNAPNGGGVGGGGGVVVVVWWGVGGGGGKQKNPRRLGRGFVLGCWALLLEQLVYCGRLFRPLHRIQLFAVFLGQVLRRGVLGFNVSGNFNQ